MRTQPNESSSDAPSLSMKVILKRHKYRLGMPNTARIINQSY